MDLLNEKKLNASDVSYYDLAEACGVLPQLRGFSGHAEAALANPFHLSESSPGVGTSLFAVITGELVARQVIAGFEDDDGYIGDKLVTVLPSKRRDQRIAGFTALAGPGEVAEHQPYEESTFKEKYVTTDEAKMGRILSISEELIGFDQTGEINRRARQLGFYLRQNRERTIVRGVADASSTVYRPSGTATALYATDGSNRNYVGVGNTTSGAPFNAAVALADHTDVDLALQYRATQVQDDRVDGSPLPIVTRSKQILTPEALRATGQTIVTALENEITSGSTMRRAANHLRSLEHLASPFLDALSAADWYIGDFRKQFVWTEIWPVQTFLQRGDSAAAFERDVALRVKSRYYGGIAATATQFVTKIDGA